MLRITHFIIRVRAYEPIYFEKRWRNDNIVVLDVLYLLFAVFHKPLCKYIRDWNLLTNALNYKWK